MEANAATAASTADDTHADSSSVTVDEDLDASVNSPDFVNPGIEL